MGLPNIFGNCNIIRLQDEREWDFKDGERAVIKYRGLKKDIYALFCSWREEGWRTRYLPENGPMAIMELRADDALDGEDQSKVEEDLPTVWSLQGNLIQKDLFSLAGIGLDGEGNEEQGRSLIIIEIKKALDQIANGTTTLNSVLDSFLGNTIARQVLLLKAQGVDSFPVTQYVANRTTTAPSKYSQKWPLKNVLKKWTHNQFKAEMNLPDTLKFQLDDIDASTYWVKQAPKITQQPNRKWQIVDEWWNVDYASDYIYPARTVAT